MSATYSAHHWLVLALLALAIGAGGCGGDEKPARSADGTLAVYSSIPSGGALAREGAAVAAGQRFALEEAGGKAGGRRVRLEQLDSKGSPEDPWDPAAIEENAIKAGDDPAAVAYLGEVGLGGSAISVPVTNADRLLQVSPGDTLPSLTQPDPGGGGEIPARYYPEGDRTFVRLVPHGGVEARVLVDWASELGAGPLAIVRDERVHGTELASWVLDDATRRGIPAEVERAGDGADDYEELAKGVAERRPKAVVLTMPAGEDADKVVLALRAALPAVPILASSAVIAHPPVGVDYVSPHLPVQEYGTRARRLLARLDRQPNVAVGPEALYGYESMRLVLDAIDRARPNGAGDREEVLQAVAGLRRVNGAFGPYSLVPGGDVATTSLATYRATAASSRFLGLRSAEPGPPAP